MTNSEALFERSWQRTWQGLGTTPPAGLLHALLAAYAEPQRRYHTQQHLAECLAHFETVQSQAQHPAEVELALWFHDAVYDIKAKDNELRSAQWAVQALGQACLAESQGGRVHELIMATRHEALPEHGDARLLVDIDLAILGADPERFAEYDAQVRAEYAWVPWPIYGIKRKQVLQGFLQRSAIYATPYFHARLEQQAHANLHRSLAA
ncbi:MAG: N-methyl-D-aspartate receptor NMDAR2C subunit [Comamonas sp.]|jgi:predicted metal-dependent HD superfamily phosphohydrolase|uniref:HD domain-containing protein n=1 Tax=Comamonas sp. TaxID=34028 RepID=UPI00282C3C87|nr:N-methyl-D-aspartate receptor NMDAR2C subunit [Comamonas sp.]MDR0212428.1 N-methyl-D-aspartate receptor NMDAR2C subunit [Comamonas sp.]